jgi:hypothetical protein
LVSFVTASFYPHRIGWRKQAGFAQEWIRKDIGRRAHIDERAAAGKKSAWRGRVALAINWFSTKHDMSLWSRASNFFLRRAIES